MPAGPETLVPASGRYVRDQSLLSCRFGMRINIRNPKLMPMNIRCQTFFAVQNAWNRSAVEEGMGLHPERGKWLKVQSDAVLGPGLQRSRQDQERMLKSRENL